MEWLKCEKENYLYVTLYSMGPRKRDSYLLIFSPPPSPLRILVWLSGVLVWSEMLQMFHLGFWMGIEQGRIQTYVRTFFWNRGRNRGRMSLWMAQKRPYFGLSLQRQGLIADQFFWGIIGVFYKIFLLSLEDCLCLRVQYPSSQSHLKPIFLLFLAQVQLIDKNQIGDEKSYISMIYKRLAI